MGHIGDFFSRSLTCVQAVIHSLSYSGDRDEPFFANRTGVLGLILDYLSPLDNTVEAEDVGTAA